MKICGVTPEDLQEDGSKAFLNLLPEDYEHLLVSTQESAKNLTPWQHEYRVRYDNGSIHTLYGDALPQLEADGSILWHGIITDITERKKTEEALKHSEQKYHTLVESASVGILVAQGDGLKFVNPNFIELSGYSETELLSMSFLDLVYADDQEQLMISYNNRLSDQATNNNYSLRMG